MGARLRRRITLHAVLGLLVGLGLCIAWLSDTGARAPDAHWQLTRAGQIRLGIVLLLAIGVAQWVDLWCTRWRKPRLAWQCLILLICSYVAVSSSPHPIAFERQIPLTPSVGTGGPVLAHDRVFLTPIWEWVSPRGTPLAEPDRARQTRYLFGVAPQSDRAGIGTMSCPDFMQSRGFLLSRTRDIALDRPDLPPGTHVDFGALDRFCWPGVRLGPDVESSASPEAQALLKRVAGPRNTRFTPFEIAAAEGQQTLSREISRQPSARGRYLLFLSLGEAAGRQLPLGEALFGAEDYFYAANQCDAAYAEFLGAQGVLYPQDAALYLAREMANTFETDARLTRPRAFVLGLAHASTPKSCRDTLAVLARLAGGESQLPPEVVKLL